MWCVTLTIYVFDHIQVYGGNFWERDMKGWLPTGEFNDDYDYDDVDDNDYNYEDDDDDHLVFPPIIKVHVHPCFQFQGIAYILHF